MRVIWVNPSPDSRIIGQAQIASFWPGLFYFVSTVQCSDEFVTQVFKCNKDMIVESISDPLFEKIYSTLSEAQTGHSYTVDLLLKGKLKLSHK